MRKTSFRFVWCKTIETLQQYCLSNHNNPLNKKKAFEQVQTVSTSMIKENLRKLEANSKKNV